MQTILVIAPANHDYARRIVRGARDSTQLNADIHTRVIVIRDIQQIPLTLKHEKPDGVIVFAAIETWEQAAIDLGIPAVNVSARLANSRIPRVMTDNYAAGQTAAEHLLNKGFRQQVFIEKTYLEHIVRRQEGWEQTVDQSGLLGKTLNFKTPRLVDKLLKLPRPLGICCCFDTVARKLLDQLIIRDIRIPHDLAIIGIDNEEDICDCGPITLTSVPNSGEQVGREAVAMLTRMIKGTKPPSKDLLIPPGDPIERASTGIHIGTSPEVSAALDYIQHNALRSISIDDVVEASGLSKATLYRRFTAELQTTPHHEIRRRRIAHAKNLLRDSDYTIRQIANHCAYAQSNHFLNAFKQATTMTPTEFRRKHT